MKNFNKRVKDLWEYFTTYEKWWFFSIVTLSVVFAVLFPEEDVLGVKGHVIMALYLADIFSNVLCELLISKQSKWNFIVSLFVEVVEITMDIVLAFRFASLAATMFFWIPIDIISFIQWNKHPDTEDDTLTEVRTLSPLQSTLVMIAIIIFTAIVGYFMTTLEIEGLLSDQPRLEVLVCYLDACATAVGIANGVFILLRYREQWITWYISAGLETILNIMAGQWILLILKAGYFTNTTYGYIKWTKYINSLKAKKAQEEQNKEVLAAGTHA